MDTRGPTGSNARASKRIGRDPPGPRRPSLNLNPRSIDLNVPSGPCLDRAFPTCREPHRGRGELRVAADVAEVLAGPSATGVHPRPGRPRSERARDRRLDAAQGSIDSCKNKALFSLSLPRSFTPTNTLTLTLSFPFSSSFPSA